MEVHKKKEVILEKQKQKHLGASLRSQQSFQLTEMDQSRDYGQTWSSLQRCVNMFSSNNGHMDTRCTLQGKNTVCTLQWEHG